VRNAVGRLGVEEPNHGHPRLVCARCKGPCSRRAANKRDECAPPHELLFPSGHQKKLTLVANDPEALKGSLKAIGGSQSDDWNNILANQTIQTLWVKHSDEEPADASTARTLPR
jgi:hypothetical protein